MTVRIALASSGQALPAFDGALLERRATALLAALGRAASELSVALVGDEEMTELNERYRGRRGPTDVLSFSLVEGDHAAFRGELLGDVVIDVVQAARQAEERGHPLQDELLRLLIHGTLHLLGHDHQEPEEAREMEACERRLWKAIGP
jgi:probable rRNA maturation factor